METITQPLLVGLVLGKFYPLTKGHMHLISTALTRCREVYVCASQHPDESIPGPTKHAWIRELFPTAHAILLPANLPYYPSECPSEDTFYTLWRDALFAACGHRFDAIFTSEDYGDLTARWLGCRHICVDPARAAVPISATRVRTEPFAHLDFLDPVVRAHYIKTICVYGPESTGKTTLCAQLADHYQTTWQPEYARWWLGERHCQYEDMVPIAEGQLRERRRYLQSAHRLLFIDTDAMTTRIYSNHYYGHTPARVQEILQSPAAKNDFYLLTDIDLPWVPDTSRDLGDPATRRKMSNDFQAGLAELRTPHATITGTGPTRLANAIQAVDQFLATLRPAD